MSRVASQGDGAEKLSSVDYGRRVGRLHRYGYYIGTLVLIPVFSIIESLGVINGLLRPNIGGFHVVDK